ncbi:MAG: tripartite tricarboxylate transporter TctB family protein [Deltaproteobacteria bacterium]|nr:tripartite tricarboxylate transporter TctB family protein [Deltaproteobacteria bacterium]
MMNVHILIPLIVAGAMVAVIAVASGYPYLQAKLSVIFSGSLVLVLALVQLARELTLKKRQADEPRADQRKPEHHAETVQYGLEFAWLVGFGLMIYLLGFFVAIPLYVFAYMKSHGSRWWASLITGALLPAFCYGIFVLLLEMKLHRGEIFMRWGF